MARTLNNLGNLYRNIRKFEKAEEFYTEALEIRRRLAQRDPRVHGPDLVKTLNSLGGLYEDQGEFKKARKFYAEASGYQDNIPNERV